MKFHVLEYGHGFSFRSTGDGEIDTEAKELIFLERHQGWTRPLVDTFLRALEIATSHQRVRVLDHLADLKQKVDELEDLFTCITSS